MASSFADLLHRQSLQLIPRQLSVNESDDKNVGSAIGNTSISAFVSTLIFNLVIFGLLVTLFIILRRTNRRIYAPRTYVGTIERWRRLKVQDNDGDGYADEVEGTSGFSGVLGWIKGVWSIPDETVLRTNGLDGYFFLRYLRKAQMICFVGCCMTWPILFPINATGGAGQIGLDILSWSNLSTESITNGRTYAHCLLGCVFYGFVLFTIYRELVFFTTMKQAYMLSPIYTTRISARTLLVQTIPSKYMNESALRRVFDNVKRVWITTDTTELDEATSERNAIAMKLEAAEVKLIKMADKERIKKGGTAPESKDPEAGEAEGESGSVAAKWLPRDKRPTHKLKPIIGEKVDTIDWCRAKLAELNPKIEELQAVERSGEGKKLNSAFIEFNTQSAAQVGLQTLAHQKPLHMAPRYIGLTPSEIIWSNMKLQWWERLVKSAATSTFVVVMVIFWSIPVAVVGTISQIKYLTTLVPFLNFINDIPEVILGIITGILPTVMLAVLMALVPIVLRLMAKIAGLPSLSLIELRVQNSYFLFQVIQVFLVTTMTSGAASAVDKIIKNPASVTGLLSESLPKASNFYISFMLLQGLAISSGALVQIVGLVVYKILGMFLDNTPRKMFNRWSSLSGLGWGTVFPIYTNMCVIALSYSMIAPLVLGFATLGLGLLYFAYRYNFLFVYNISIDTKGMVYPRALYQTMSGVYIGQICMIGLFAINAAKSPGPLIIQIIFLIFTILFQNALSAAVQPLLDYLPKNLQVEEESLLTIENGEQIGKESTSTEVATEHEGVPLDTDNDAIPGLSEETKPSLLTRFLQPEKYESYQHLRKRIPQEAPEIVYSPEVERDAYYHPSITQQAPAIWIPRDVGGVSRQEVAHTGAVNPISDYGAILDAGSKIERHDDAFPPDWSEKPLW